MNAEFDLSQVEQAIAETRFQGRVLHFAVADSTNRLALEAARKGTREGVWIADEQLAGRGRGGHAWHSSAGTGLYVSVLVTPGIPLSEAARIPLAAGLAARAAVMESAGLTCDLRWPNDLMFDERKFGGILVESASETQGTANKAAMLRFAVIGIGINVNHVAFPPELTGLATSLRMEAGRSFMRESLLASLLRHLEGELSNLEAASQGFQSGPDLGWRFGEASTWVSGKRVTVQEAGGYCGITRGLDRNGFLLVEDDGGRLRTVMSGGVRSA